jgi:hypothetical protein
MRELRSCARSNTSQAGDCKCSWGGDKYRIPGVALNRPPRSIERRKIQIALKVLARQYDVKAQRPTPEEIETLKSLFGDRAGSMTLHEIARTVIERELPKKEGRRIPPR